MNIEMMKILCKNVDVPRPPARPGLRPRRRGRWPATGGRRSGTAAATPPAGHEEELWI